MSVALTCLKNDVCVLQVRDERLMLDLFAHGVLTRDQIIRLGYFGSIQRCNSRLLRLKRHGFIQLINHPAIGGSSPALYSVGRRASPLLAERLQLSEGELLRATSSGAALSFLEHTLLLTEMRIIFERSFKGVSTGRYSWRGEALCRHVYLSGNHKRVIKPDACMRWQTGRDSENWFVELDLGNASQAAIRSKLETYVQYQFDGAYREVYGDPQFGLILVTTGRQRVQNLLRLCAALPFPTLATERRLLFCQGPLADIWSRSRAIQQSTWPSNFLGGNP